MRTRRDVWKLADDPTDKTLYWYSIAVQEMQNRFFDNPLSWKFQAAIHGYDVSLFPPLRPGESLPAPGTQATYWNQCEHASWFFPPWHRIYVYLFEQLCRSLIAARGGPSDWSLPYWDYSHPDGAKQRTLPNEFRNPTLSGGADNPLYADRGPRVNAGGTVGSAQQSENTTCMKSTAFSGQFPNGFGGGSSAPLQFSHYTGSCENGPHNSMHDAIGGLNGWMDNTNAAALDPIFWLHHTNIDRLWVIWQSDVNKTLPSDAQWNNQTFDFFDPTGSPKSYAVKDVLQTTGPLCDYVYEDTTNPLGPVAVPRRTGRTAGLPLERFVIKAMRKAEMIGASTEPSVTLGSDVASVSFRLYAPTAIAEVTRALSLREPAPESQRVHLALENVTAQDRPIHTYEVYVNVPEGETPSSHPELMAGLIPRFGLVEASQPDKEHGGQGLNLSFDITDIVLTLEKNNSWDPNNLRITFAPHDKQEDVKLASEGRPVPPRQPVTVGRVGVYTQSGA
jgi:tyrosinase